MNSLAANVVLWSGLLGAETVVPDEIRFGDSARYYVVVFAAQDALNTPQRTHTWATFIQLSPLPSGRTYVRRNTISWLPANYSETFRLTYLPSCGRNHSLQETLQLMRVQELAIRYWGPFEVAPVTYAAAINQIAYLDSGQVDYQVLEPVRRVAAYWGFGGGLDCVHALTDVVGFIRTGTTRGHDAGALVTRLYANGEFIGDSPPGLFDAIVHD